MDLGASFAIPGSGFLSFLCLALGITFCRRDLLLCRVLYFCFSPDIPFTSWWWDSTLFRRLLPPLFRTPFWWSEMLLFQMLLMAIWYIFLPYLNMSLSNSFSSWLKCCFTRDEKSKILPNKLCSSWVTSVPVQIALVCIALFLNQFLLETKWQNSHSIPGKVFCTKCW